MRPLSGLAGVVGLLHLAGWGLFALYAGRYPALAGLGTLAYAFGMRHAFDADHIAAIDNASRRSLATGRKRLGVGLWFSLGHATIVLGLTVALALGTGVVDERLPVLQSYGGTIGAVVAGSFLWVVGLLNLAVLADLVRTWRGLRRGTVDAASLGEVAASRGLVGRLGGLRLLAQLSPWRMVLVGLLFGLGFDTATEVGLLALTAGAATHAVPLLAVLSLPLLFAAGMTLFDTADGVVMGHAYGWALARPARRVHVNLTVTGLSVVVALLVGTVELLQLVAGATVDLSRLGYVVVALFVLVWVTSAGAWRAAGLDAGQSAVRRR